MKILYVGYWPSGDGLTQSAIVPRLKVLASFEQVDEIFFCSIERDIDEPAHLHLPKVTHVFFTSNMKSNVILTKISDFSGLNSLLSKLVGNHEISLVICNSTLAGIVGYQLFKRHKKPFVVECFEPHSMYMNEVGVWQSWDPRYLILKHYEQRQKKSALRLATVSKNYTEKLISEGVDPKKIATVPNCVSLDEFKFDVAKRSSKRAELSIDAESIVGIYVGKFGDIYYDDEAFDLFSQAAGFFGVDFKLILLTQADPVIIAEKLTLRNVPIENVRIMSVPHASVPEYLSAADFAFSTIRPSPARLYCSPIKNGEYWAAGLPILTEDGIGEDSEIIKTEGGGFVFDFRFPHPAFEKLATFMKKGRGIYATEIFETALKHRRMSLLVDYYVDLLARK